MNEAFVETLEYRRFAEFCDACRRYQYIGLCYGPPGVGKTLSARRYAGWDKVAALPPVRDAPMKHVLELQEHRTVFYTSPVVNTPGILEREIAPLRRLLHSIRLEPLRREEEAAFDKVREEHREREKEHTEKLLQHNWLDGPLPALPRVGPIYERMARGYEERRRQITDPTDLILVDEADRLKMASLEGVRAVFDRGGIGLVLIGMPGMEKRLARYAQFYSRIGFVHEFRPLAPAQVRELLTRGWNPPGMELAPLDDEAVTAVIRITGGNFRLLDRLLSQTERIVRINDLKTATRQAVEAARESLVIGQS